MVIQHNLMAMNADRMGEITGTKKKKSIEKLSSGNRINRAADDAAGLAISEKMRRQIRGLTQATFNCQDGISLVQTADGALNEITDMLQRGNELCVKAANGTLSPDDRKYIQKEISALADEIDKVSARTTFNEIPILKGEEPVQNTVEIKGGLPSWASSPSISAGYLSDTFVEDGKTHATAVMDFSGFAGSAADFAAVGDGNAGFNTTCATCSNHYTISFTNDPSKQGYMKSGSHHIYTVDISGCTSGEDITDRILGMVGSRPQGHYTSLSKDASGNLLVYDNRAIAEISPSKATFKDGIATAKQAGTADVVIQAGAEAGTIIEIKLPRISSASCGIGGVNATTPGGAVAGIKSLKTGIAYVNSERSRMGAYQNRMEHTINNLNNVVENTTAAESAIRDTDMAKEMVNLSTQNILEQVGQSMLTQANQSKQGVLSLLQ